MADRTDTAAASAATIEAVGAGYAFDGPALDLGALVTPDGTCHADVPVRIPLAMVNRHGLIAGATGTGKTKTLQLMAEQLSAHGVPVFAADIKGDLSGLVSPGQSHDKIDQRARDVGQTWTATGCPVEYLALGGEGVGVPVRATISSFGPMLLGKTLGLNEVQESSLGLIFHYADKAGLPLLDLKDLRAVVQHLMSDEGKDELEGLGGLSKATAGVILRELVGFADQGADRFFGEPELDTADLMRVTSDGKGVITLLELPQLQDRPALFSTFLMWVLADLFHDLPEVGDVDKPKLVFFFDEAHLLFNDASKDFLQTIAQTVRLIRSKGVGVFFVTQTPTDVPDDVLAQLGNRVQHALRAHTPNDAKALKSTVSTFPLSEYDLAETLTQLGTGEAVITVLSERGAPTPVAWTRLRAPQSLMAPTAAEQMQAAVAASPLQAEYGQAIDRESAYERLTTRLAAGADDAEAETAGEPKPGQPTASADGRDESRYVPLPDMTTVGSRRERDEPTSQRASTVEAAMGNPAFKSFLRSAGSALGREVIRGMFGTGRRRRRR